MSQPLKAHSLDLRAWPKAIIDACCPYDFIREFPEVAEASKELQETVRKKMAVRARLSARAAVKAAPGNGAAPCHNGFFAPRLRGRRGDRLSVVEEI